MAAMMQDEQILERRRFFDDAAGKLFNASDEVMS